MTSSWDCRSRTCLYLRTTLVSLGHQVESFHLRIYSVSSHLLECSVNTAPIHPSSCTPTLHRLHYLSLSVAPFTGDTSLPSFTITAHKHTINLACGNVCDLCVTLENSAEALHSCMSHLSASIPMCANVAHKLVAQATMTTFQAILAPPGLLAIPCLDSQQHYKLCLACAYDS